MIVVDAHIDTTQRLLDGPDDIARRLPDGHVDIPRLLEGGVTAAFFAIWVGDRYGPGTALARARALIAAVHELAARDPRVRLATDAAGVREAARRGQVAALLGVEGGHAIENSLENLDAFRALGVRYLTLTWNNGNDWAGASMDPDRPGGLTAFGRDVIRRMNDLGMLVDLSHVSDATFRDVLAVARAPVIASHSCCRALADHPRNLTDPQLAAIAATGGVVGVNFYPVFLDAGFAAVYQAVNERLAARFAEIRAQQADRPGVAELAVDRLRLEHLDGVAVPGLERLLDHIEHAVTVMGIEHVGLGSDFDGIGVLPPPLKDVTSLPLVAAALGARGFGDSDVRKICGENFLRVL